MMNRFVAVLLVSGALSVAQTTLAAPQSSPTDRELAVGDPAPPLAFETVLDGSTERQFRKDDLKGKTVVLEFWATWCGPCVEAIPHLNELIDQMRDEPIRFISATEETPEHIRTFIAEHPIKGWIAFDPSKRINSAYGVAGIPQTFIITPDGRIAASTDPFSVTEEVLRAVLKGQPASLPPLPRIRYVPPGTDPDNPDSKTSSLAHVEIRPCPASDLSRPMAFSVTSPAKMTAVCADSSSILSMAFDTSRDRFFHPDLLPAGRYTVISNFPDAFAEQGRHVLQDALQLAFKVRAQLEDRETDVLLLRRISGAELGLRPSEKEVKREIYIGRTEWSADAVPVDHFCSWLEGSVGKPVVNDTGLTGNVSFKFKLAPDDPSMNQTLRDQGLELVPGRRVVQLLVIEKSPGN